MKRYVIDTNVIIVANENCNHANHGCIKASIENLEDIVKNKMVVIDSGHRILDEYKRYASFSGAPGVGDAFFRWLWNNQANPKHCEQVDITERSGSRNDFVEFPTDPDLNGFDRSDRKFVAVAKASSHSPTILNATDGGWWSFKSILERNDIKIDFICPDLMS